MSTEDEKKADQELFKALVAKRLKEVFAGVQADLAAATGKVSDKQQVNRFLNGREPVGVVVAERWAKALRIRRTEMPASLRWPVRPKEEAREALAPYLSELSRMERLPYYAVLRSMLETDGPPMLTEVYVRPEYRTESGMPHALGSGPIDLLDTARPA